MKIKVLDPKRFEAEVFGGWAFLENWPHITTEGVEVVYGDPYGYEMPAYYMVKPDGKPVNDSAFFSNEDVALPCVELIP